MNNIIEVAYEVGSTIWKYQKLLKKLEGLPVIGFDVETCGVYSKEERETAKKALSSDALIPPTLRSQYILVANNSGLSHPSLVRTTHFVFGISSSQSIVLVASKTSDEIYIWNWIKRQKSCFIIHNALFDLRIMLHRVGSLPENYEDTALLAKCLINNADNFKSKIGLKVLVGSYYKPAWSLFDMYEPEDLLNPDFIEYAATDGGAVLLLWEQLQEHLKEK